MAASIFLNRLSSRVTRSNLTNRLNTSIIGGGGQRNEQGGLITRVTRVIGNVLGTGFNWIMNAVKGIGWSFTGLYQAVVGGLRFLANFNWNISDVQIDTQLEALNKRIWAQLGETIGVTLGYTVCGLLPSAGIMTFNQPLGLFLLYRVGEEAFDEISAELMALARIAWQNELTKWFYNTFKATRKIAKKHFEDPNSPQSVFGRRIFGENFNKAVESWGAEGSEPFIISEQIEEGIDDIPNERTRIIVEEAYEAFIDSCFDAGYIVSGGLDEWVMQQRALKASSQANNPERVIEFIPNRAVETESYIIRGDEETLQNEIPMVFQQWQQISDRNVGVVIQDHSSELGSRQPNRLGLSARFMLTSVEGYRFADTVKAIITVHDIERSKLDFERIVRALGGQNGYIYGDYFCKVTLDNRDSIQLYADSPQSGLGRLRDLAALTSHEILRFNNPTAPLPEFHSKKRKPKVRLYPYSMTLTYKSASLKDRYDRNLDDDDQVFKEVNLRLWGDKPDHWNSAIAQLFTIANPQPQN